MHIKLIGCNGRYTHSTLSLFYLRQIFEKNITDVRLTIQQFTINDSYFETLTRITDEAAECYCFSVYIWNSTFIQRLLEDLSHLRPSVPLVIGGPEAAELTKLLDLDNLTLVTGEAEGLPTVFFDDLNTHQLKKTYQCRKTPSFSSPYRDADFLGPLANRHIYYESSRGCPYSCSYCLSARETGVRHLEINQVKEEIDLILKYQPKIIRFIDRTFNALPQRTLEIWRHLLALQTDTSFHFEISPDIFTDEMFELLESVPVGKFQFEIGLQSTHEPTLAAVARKTKISQALDNIKRLVTIKTIHLHVDLILGLPHDTPESYQQTFNDLFALAPHYIQMGLLKILPDTPLARQQQEFGLVASRQPPYELLQNKWLSHEQLKELYWLGECVEKFYNCLFFKPLFTYLRAQNENGFLFFTTLLTICHKHNFFRHAATHELMSSILAEMAQTRQDTTSLLEVLQLSWLYSGHRKLPDHLPPQDLKKNKARLFQQLPQNLPPYFSHVNRNHFFKRAEFALFGPTTLRTLFHYQGTSPRLICFLPDIQKGAMKHNEILLVADDNLSLQPQGK
ncbi:MAG: DUF4080 domain-containing protein [Proteobacteria bacterium]|nr:DUF4080 domain-containing protein [Pseudomonadota bacterium]MBU1640307.1 DUF4080 domain-containing protein [Pseudomonadota bacterium]